MKFPRHVILICEDGWEGIREFALFLSEKRIPVSVIIKGEPGDEVKEMISPKAGIRNYFFERNLYRLILYPLLMGLFLVKRWNIVCITKERTYKELLILQRFLGFDLYLFFDSGKDSVLQANDGSRIPMRKIREETTG